MPNYKFRFVDRDGTTHEGVAEADDRDSLISELRSKGTVLELEEIALGGEKKESPGQIKIAIPQLDFGFSKEDLALFTRQLATTLAAGLPIMKILGILRKRCSSAKFGRILDDISRDIQNGARFSEALEKHPRTFDAMYVNLAKVGEASGKMGDMIDRLATLMDKDAALQRRVKSAMAYPGFILFFTVALSYGIVSFLMPLFAPMFTSSGLDIKNDYPLTYILLNISYVATNPAMIALGIACIIGASIGYREFSHTTAGRATIDRLVFYAPLLRTLFRYAATARFARTLSSLMGAGIPLLQSLQLTGAAAGNAVVTGAVERIANGISKGRKISDAIEGEDKIFPDLLIQMTQVGEESGALPQMLERAADYYDTQVDSAVAKLVAVLEPGMMVVVGGIVCGFVMAVLLPILGLAKVS